MALTSAHEMRQIPVMLPPAFRDELIWVVRLQPAILRVVAA
jgi:hypothetical protein